MRSTVREVKVVEISEEVFKIIKKWTFCVLDVLYPGHSVTGRLVTGRFVSWTFCILDVLYPGRSVTGRLVTGRFVSWTFCILDVL
jgi:hypothetical protein